MGRVNVSAVVSSSFLCLGFGPTQYSMLLIFVVLESQCGGDGGWKVWGALEF